MREAPPYASETDATTCEVAGCVVALGCPNASATLVTASWRFPTYRATVYVAPALGSAQSWEGTVSVGDAVTLKSGDFWSILWRWGLDGGATSTAPLPAVRTFATVALGGRTGLLLYPSSRYGDAQLVDPTSPATHSFVLSQHFIWQAQHTALVVTMALFFALALGAVGAVAWRKASLVDAVVALRIATGPLALLLALAVLVAMLTVCFVLSLNLGHISLAWGFPAISMTGQYLPEHFYFVCGFICVALLLASAQVTYACLAIVTRPDKRVLVLVHLGIGLLQCPTLILMAVLNSIDTEIVHVTFAIAGLLALVVYEGMHVAVDYVVFERRWWRKACWVWYALTCAGTLGGVIGWFTGCMPCEWAAVGCIFLHFVPWFAVLLVRPPQKEYVEVVDAIHF